MLIGHLNLDAAMNDTGERFVNLVRGLSVLGIRQFVLLRDRSLASRLEGLAGIEVGPAVQSAVTAFCLVPNLDLAHIHDPAAAQAGLLLTLTRSIPYVLSHRRDDPLVPGPLKLAVYRRAAHVICHDDADASILRHFDPSLRIAIVPDLAGGSAASSLLEIYQNSQRTPIAGNSGSQ